MTAQLQTAKLSLDDLLLDPNNPRFVEDLRLQSEVPDDDVPSRQEDLLKKFPISATDGAPEDGEEDSFFGIQDLVDSMRQIGFVPIDRVVVRALTLTRRGGGKKYLVIEGNRRVSAAKKLRQADRDERDPTKKLSTKIAASLDQLDVLVLDTNGLSPAEVHDRVGVILGLRHYGAVLPWEPMARAKNIYTEYMQGHPTLQSFKFSSRRASDVARRLSVPRNDVKKALSTYIAFKQLQDSFQPGPRPDHYSLIQNLVTSNRLLRAGYLKQDEASCEMSSESLERINQVCQFDTRDQLPSDKKILAEPKSVAPFVALVSDAMTAGDDAVKSFASGLLAEVERGERSVDDAKDNLTSFKFKRKWTESLNQLLEKQAASLPLSDFAPEGNALMHLGEVNEAFENIRLIFKL